MNRISFNSARKINGNDGKNSRIYSVCPDSRRHSLRHKLIRDCIRNIFYFQFVTTSSAPQPQTTTAMVTAGAAVSQYITPCKSARDKMMASNLKFKNLPWTCSGSVAPVDARCIDAYTFSLTKVFTNFMYKFHFISDLRAL